MGKFLMDTFGNVNVGTNHVVPENEQKFFSTDDVGFREGLQILNDVYANRPESLPLAFDTAFSMDEFVAAIDANPLQGVDLDDVEYDFSLLRRASLFVLKHGDAWDASRIDRRFLNLPKDFDPENPKYTEEANALIASVRSHLIPTEILNDYLKSIPESGTVAQIFADPEKVEMVASLGIPVIHDHEAKIVITWFGGAKSTLVFTEPYYGTAETVSEAESLSTQIGEFYAFAAESRPYGREEMIEQYEEIRAALSKNKEVKAVHFFISASGGAVLLKLSRDMHPADRSSMGSIGVFLLFMSVLHIYDTYHPSEVQKLGEQGLSYFQQFETADDFVAALEKDPEMKKLMQTAYWLSRHQ